MQLEPTHPRPVDVLRANRIGNVMRQLMPQRSEIGADLDEPVGMCPMDPHIIPDVEVLVSPLATAVVSDQYLGPWRILRIVPTGIPTCNDLLPRGVEVLTPRCVRGGGGCATTGCECDAEQNQSLHTNKGSHLAADCQP